MLNFKQFTMATYLFESIDMNINTKAFAKMAHAGQIRKVTKSPYFHHPYRVYGILKKIGVTDEDVFTAAFLHDTLEDTKITDSEIERRFGRKVLMLVKELTSDKKESKKIGKTKYLIRKMNNMSDDALMLKLADRYDNLKDLKIADKKWSDKYAKSTEEILQGIKLRTRQHKILYKMIMDRLQSYYN